MTFKMNAFKRPKKFRQPRLHEVMLDIANPTVGAASVSGQDASFVESIEQTAAGELKINLKDVANRNIIPRSLIPEELSTGYCDTVDKSSITINTQTLVASAAEDATAVIQDLTFTADNAGAAGNDISIEYEEARARLEVQDLTYYAVEAGPDGEDISIEYVAGGVAADLIFQDITFEAVEVGPNGNDITVEYEEGGVASTLIEQDLTYTAVEAGPNGDNITVEYEEGGVAATLIEQDLTYTAVEAGPNGNSITVEYEEGGVAATLIEQDLTFTSVEAGPNGDNITVEYEEGGIAATLVLQDLTFTAVEAGPNGNSITVTYTSGGTAGAELVTVVGSAITVQIDNGDSTATQIKAALDAESDFTDIASVAISGTGSNVQFIVAPTPLAGGALEVTVTTGAILVGLVSGVTTATQVKAALDAETDFTDIASVAISGTGSNAQVTAGPTALAGGALTVTVTTGAILVGIVSAVTTATQIKAALDAETDFTDIASVAISGMGGDDQVITGPTALAGGALDVTVTAGAILVGLVDGVTTATQVKAALDAESDFTDIASVVISGTGSNAQDIVAPTNLAGGALTVTVVSGAILVGLASGISTATQVKAALDAESDFTDIATATISGTAGDAQVIAGPTALAGGALEVTVTGDAIVVGLVDGVTTAQQVKDAIDDEPTSSALVTVLITGTDTDPQDVAASDDLVQEVYVLVDSTDILVGLLADTDADAVLAAIEAEGPAAALVDIAVSGSGSAVQAPQGPTSLEGGENAYSAGDPRNEDFRVSFLFSQSPRVY